ncbi:hypothetical protein [Bacillus paramycoides]|uniref:hypothetical protein n=1 Tax=Bacillus paramycoides TaxID=2026194 RepID=UPI002E248A7A|nr:hypothetical protein [Bacillus paramycoides]
MDFNRWLTDEEYQQAASYGISRQALSMRMYTYGWDPMKAATTKPKIKRTKKNIS